MARSILERDKAAALFHALSDATRLDLLERLKGGEHCVCELTGLLKSAQSRLSFHLKVLKDAGLLNDRREGRWMYYSVNRQALDDLEEFIADMKKGVNRIAVGSNCC
jgi:ArsR family transcriptional regulator